MPIRQETFRLVPTTLVNKTIPRPPMTSKAAKKAYREANKLPRVSKAEQRRLEREEIARQKREYEKERAAAKAKAVREKKQLKEKEERERRRKEGLPEPSRYVRANQPTIKVFVKSGLGSKRSWEDADNGDNEVEDAGALTRAHYTLGTPKKAEGRATADILSETSGIEDNSGGFCLPPEDNLASLVETIQVAQKPAITSKSPRPHVSTPSPKRLRYSYKRQETQRNEKENQQQPDPDGERWGNIGVEDALKVQSSISKTHPQPMKGFESPEVLLDNMGTSQAGRKTRSLTSVPVISGPPSAKKSAASAYAKSYGQPREELPRAMQPPPLPLSHASVGNKQSRKPLSDLSNNVAPSPLPKLPKPISAARTVAHTNLVRLQGCSALPPSTQAFLEAHLDDFFPSPSQQVRELMDDIDDVPSNTQITREIDATPSPEIMRRQLPQVQPPVEAIDLSCFSSQDFVISSQDLRDIDTLSRALPLDALSSRQALPPPSSFLAGPQKPSSAVNEVMDDPNVTDSQHLPRSTKPRFFEEKEEDLLYAALHESFLMANEKTQSSSPKRSQRTLQRVRSIRTDDGNDEFGFDDFDVDPEFLAALDGVEKNSFHGSFTCITRV